jgi:hypothetical protein
MNRLRYLKNRIRGWLPKEPNHTKPFQQNSQTPMGQKNPAQNFDSIEQRTSMIVLTPLAVGMGIYFFSLMISYYNHTGVLQVIGVILGLVIGSLISFPFTRRELNLLAEKGEIRKGFKSLILNVIAASIFPFSFGILLFSDLPLEISVIYWNFVFALLLGDIILDFILRFRWESVNKKRIMYQGFWIWRRRVYAVPKRRET